MAAFIKPNFASTTTSTLINIELVKSITKGSADINKRNESGELVAEKVYFIYFDGDKLRWEYADLEERDREFDRLASNNF